MDIEVDTTYVIEKNMYLNHMDEAYGLICVFMSPNISFHIESCTIPYDIWTNLEDLFGKQGEMRGHMLEIKLNSLAPRNFDNIHDLFIKFKSLILHIKGCGLHK
jgi:hypothetical protein